MEINAVRSLAKVLSGLKGQEYEGSVIGSIFFKSGVTGQIGLEIVRKTKGFCVIVCRSTTDEVKYEMKVTILLKGRVNASKEFMPSETVMADAEQMSDKCFNDEEVHEFVEAVGDTNYIHQGPRPIVPGMQILEYLYLSSRESEINLRFHHPVRAGEKIFFNKDQRTATSGGRKIFTVNYGG